MDYSIAIHGGAGTMDESKFTPEVSEQFHQALQDALEQGSSILSAGGPAFDAVEAVIIALENDPLFNASLGACFTYEGDHELDASIMDGLHLTSGAVAGLKRTKNPVKAAKEVMLKTDHLLLGGPKADQFAQEQGLEMVDNDYFTTEYRKNHWLKIRETENLQVEDAFKFGTVGAVAIDKNGNLAAATSTGGITNKRHGRIGDTPLIGAGNYANNETCAISCTGKGELFMENLTAYDIHARMKYAGQSLHDAVEHHIKHSTLAIPGGGGGLIAINTKGEIEIAFNTAGMYRAHKKENQPTYTGIFTTEIQRGNSHD